MDTIKLRILTEKSTLGFGQYAEMSIRQIIDLTHTSYLRWVYYTYEGISFNEEILTKIGVFGENYDHRIKKPGTNKELHEKLNKIKLLCSYSYNNPKKVKNKIKSVSKIKLRTYNHNDKIKYSRKNLQSKNHGH